MISPIVKECLEKLDDIDLCIIEYGNMREEISVGDRVVLVGKGAAI